MFVSKRIRLSQLRLAIFLLVDEGTTCIAWRTKGPHKTIASLFTYWKGNVTFLSHRTNIMLLIAHKLQLAG